MNNVNPIMQISIVASIVVSMNSESIPELPITHKSRSTMSVAKSCIEYF